MNLPSIKSHIPFPDTQKQELATSGKPYNQEKEVYEAHFASRMHRISNQISYFCKQNSRKRKTKKGQDSHELDYSYHCRPLRSRIHLLSGQGKGCHRMALLGMDGRLPGLHDSQHVATGQSHTDTAHRYGLSRMDGYRCSGHRVGGHLLFS